MIQLDDKNELLAVLLPDESGVNIGITVPGFENQNMWIITPDILANVLKGKATMVPHAERQKPTIVTKST